MSELSKDLQRALGFNNENSKGKSVWQPYLDYIKASWTGRGEPQEFLRFFLEVILHFQANTTAQTQPAPLAIQVYIDSLCTSQDHYFFNDTIENPDARESSVKETVLLILGTWLLTQSYFVPSQQEQRRIVHAYCLTTKQEYSEGLALDLSISQLLLGSGLVPCPEEGKSSAIDGFSSFEVIDASETPETFPLHSSVGLLESLRIDSTRLNATRLFNYGQVEIAWTHNILRHMILSKRAGSYVLEVFALPCAIQGGSEALLSRMGISTDLIDEIECSYATLFNPRSEPRWHKKFGWVFGIKYWCLCLYCTAYRYKRRVLEKLRNVERKQGEVQMRSLGNSSNAVAYDDQIRVLMERKAWHWDQTDFSNLWPRIIALDSHLQRARPWSFWVLFRDKRETVQYWTFLFGTIILVLTIVQVALGIAQVAGSF